jgi:cupin 2 domain-containing protein
MNLLSNLPTDLPEELTTILQKGNGVRIERIVSTGHKSPEGFWYDQPENEWVMVLQGSARLQFEDRVVEMLPGDSINIPAHQKHRVEWTTPDEPTVWLAVFTGRDPHVLGFSVLGKWELRNVPLGVPLNAPPSYLFGLPFLAARKYHLPLVSSYRQWYT